MVTTVFSVETSLFSQHLNLQILNLLQRFCCEYRFHPESPEHLWFA
ncbi:hypothetical protein VCHA54P496_100083 [Vibrio chagasii]|nr:hypothetical protein VCHA36P168_110096 [Vibrio chagasii]CAH6819706.1 hypothetical protein VCHA28FP16_150028 [Vibrio chagasii]CAH6910157.1 hypothetical protein VCHA43P282_100097 [Vibrio chagasii]CAH6925933.1 hypothetical protein VCHA54P495_100083 [Vibrio chagasii]CAH6932172.1 hypothetical protein VCHA54P496_100083 [Vibrio chagasii]